MEVRSGGEPVRVSGKKPRMLLATLLLNAGHVVGTDQLVEVLWSQRPPRSAQANVRTYVSSLRSDLGGGHLRGDGTGYAIDVSGTDLDLLRFEDLVARGGFAEALALWRGAPLADLPGSPLWDRRLDPLLEVRLRAAERLIADLLERGDQTGAITQLRTLLAEHPYREDLWRQLLLALHRAGRKAEALKTYGQIRAQLVDELGVEPGTDLRRAYETILADESAPGGPRRLPADEAPSVPRQLPPDLPDFTGRGEQLAALAGPFRVAIVSGPPGAGKSALAVHAAHALRERYPEGQLYLDLAGREAGDVLAEALRALGVETPPPTAHERSALLRTLLAERPMLVLLDDAGDAEQIRPLLPGNGSVVLVTSRKKITDLPGALQVDVGELPAADALRLLGRIAGTDRLAREPEAAKAIVAACGGLPLAVRSAGARLAARPGWSLAVLRDRLEDDLLGELKEVRASLDRSYAALPEEAARALGALGRLGGQAQPGWVIGAVLDRPRAEDVTDLLVDANLLRLVGTDQVGQPRYVVPGLIGAHALERHADPSAVGRVLAAWTAATEHAMTRLPTVVFSLTSARAPRWELPARTLDRLTADPAGWFAAEHDTLVAAVGVAAEAGPSASAWGLAAALVPYFDLRCHFDAWQRTHTLALAAARANGDRYGEAAMLRGLAQVSLYQDRYEEAAAQFARARRIFQALGEPRAEATTLCGLAAVALFRGDQVRALGHYRRALAMFLAAGDQNGEAFVRQAIGRLCLGNGDLARAGQWLDQAMRLAQELGDSHREACVSLQIGKLQQAVSFHRHALDIFDSLGDRHCGAYAMQGLAGLQVARGEWAPASAGLERSLEVFQELGDRSGEAQTTQMLGELHHSAGRPHLARDYLEHASTLRRSL
ncbi:AfsR/SARP family transcriptional regulator [Nonomuraea typhae]|uniref:AfsR/SARP family transcriptional regulator n=1 Tax=Nonomuraea typhae TaxID=2603600 RepID=UPI001FE8566F|nr:AfsR/SARP family transcriptional regulator [Nonomuraea typhae]